MSSLLVLWYKVMLCMLLSVIEASNQYLPTKHVETSSHDDDVHNFSLDRLDILSGNNQTFIYEKFDIKSRELKRFYSKTLDVSLSSMLQVDSFFAFNDTTIVSTMENRYNSLLDNQENHITCILSTVVDIIQDISKRMDPKNVILITIKGFISHELVHQFVVDTEGKRNLKMLDFNIPEESIYKNAYNIMKEVESLHNAKNLIILLAPAEIVEVFFWVRKEKFPHIQDVHPESILPPRLISFPIISFKVYSKGNRKELQSPEAACKLIDDHAR